MSSGQQQVFKYKWDQWTGSGYRLRYDAADVPHHYHVEDWDNHVVVEDYGCADLDDALKVLDRFFKVDASRERSRIEGGLSA